MTIPVDDPAWPPVKVGEEPPGARRFLILADALEAGPGPFALDDSEFQVVIYRAASALRAAATSMVVDGCRMDVPYARLYQVRKADGKVRWTCDHVPPHETDA